MPNLSNSALAGLPRTVEKPCYDRNAMQAGILHIGAGNFFRAHQALYTDHVLAAGDNRWGIIGASLRHNSVLSALAPQDFLYSLTEKFGDQSNCRVVGSLKSIIHIQGHESSLINYIGLPSIKIISLTITEKGYCLHGQDKTLDESHPDILHDLAHPDAPRSAIGFLVAGLKQRIASDLKLPTLLSCDNLSSNGASLHKAIIRFAELRDLELAKKLDAELTCPSTMVDRIVPQTTDKDRSDAESVLGFRDSWPVVTEPFSQWIIESRFSLDRPDWAQFGAKFVSSVAPYEHAKLRLLNASHTAMAFIGLICGLTTVSDVMRNVTLKTFIERLMRNDIATVLEPPVDLDIGDYIDSLLSRFKNPALQHQLLQIASDSSQKIPLRLVQTMETRLVRGLPLNRLAYVIAGFIILLERRHMRNADFLFHDPQGEGLTQIVLQSGNTDADRIVALLSDRDIFGSIGENSKAIEEVKNALEIFRRKGVIKAIGDFEKT